MLRMGTPPRLSRPARRNRPAPSPPTAVARRPAFTLHAGTPAAWPALTWAAFAVVAVYAALTFGLAFGPHRVGDVFTETDFYGSYGPGARLIQHGHLIPSRYGVVGPVFELLLAATGFVVRDLFLAAGLIAALSMTAALLLWWSLFARRAGPAVALVAVVLMATNAQCFRYGWSVTTDAPAFALQAAALWALLGARGTDAERGPVPSPRRLFAAGALAAFAFLTRYNSVALLPAGLLAIGLGWNGVEKGGRLRSALVFAAGFLAPVLPWVLYSVSHGGAMRFQLHHNIAYEVFARPHGIVWDVYEHEMEGQFPTPWSVLARDPAAVISRMGFNLFDHLRLDALRLTGLPLALAAAIGAWCAGQDGLLGKLKPLLAAMALFFLTLVPAFHSERYSLAVLPLWCVLAAAAFASPRFALTIGGVWLKLLLLPLVLVPAIAVTQAFAARVLYQLPVEAREAGEKIRPLVRPGDKVMARKPHFAWYAGATPLTLPLADTLATWGDAARRMGARWLYFSWPEAELRPRFEWLLDSTSRAPGLTVRAATSHWPAIVYEVGPDFGREPDWVGLDTLVALHRARARVQVDERDVRARVFLAMHEFSHRNHEAAQAYIDQLLVLAPEDLDVLMLAAENRLQLKDPDGALTYYDRYDRLHPGSPEVSVGRGWVAVMKGDDATAARYWAPVVNDTADPVTLERMVYAFAAVGDRAHMEQAREALKGMRGTP
jgi:dolichyl-phosphate-mannose-protein mannosyltransferase